MKAAPPLPAAPTDRNAKLVFVIAALFAASGALGAGWPLFAAAALCLWAGHRRQTIGRAAQRTHAALQAITRGRYDEAEAHLDAIPTRAARHGSAARAVAYQRALIAFYRGEAARAVELVERATAERTALATSGHERVQRALALSLRALAHASLGQTDEARADAAAAVASPYAPPEALARARLAEGIALARGGGQDALQAHLASHGALVLEHTAPRERALARALRRMGKARARSAYREPAAPAAEAAPDDALGAWIARIAPEAAAFAGASPRLAERTEAAPVPAALPGPARAVKVSRRAAGKRQRGPLARVAALWVVLVGIIFGVMQALSSRAPSPGSRGASSLGPVAVPLVAVALFASLVVVAIARARRLEGMLVSAQRAMTLGDHATAEPLLARLAAQSGGLGAAQAWWLRARAAEETARFDECVAHCDRALASIDAQLYGARAWAAFALTPGVLALRALALAALGREGEANAELATIADKHAAFGHRAVGELRVRLVAAVRRGDLDGARAVAAQRTPELPLPLRDEVLADLVLATAPHGASRDEQERIDTELRESPALAAWVDAIAPGLRDELAQRVAQGTARIAPSAAAGEDARAEEDEEPAARARA